MKQDVFIQKSVASYLAKNFVPVMLDVEDDILPEGFSYYAVPTFFIVSPEGKSLERVVGGTDAKHFLEYLKKVKSQF